MLPPQRLYLPVSLRYSQTIQFNSVYLSYNDLTFALNGCPVFQAPHGAMMVMQTTIVVCLTHKSDVRTSYCWDLQTMALFFVPVVKPSQWNLLRYSHCGGTRQSPINIKKQNVVVDKHLNAFTFKMFDDKHVIDHVINTGHTGF